MKNHTSRDLATIARKEPLRALLIAIDSGNVQHVQELLKRGINPNIDCNSPLKKAILKENIRIVKLLLEHGATPCTCLKLKICWRSPKFAEIIKLLHSYHPEPLQFAKLGLINALTYKNTTLIQYFLNHGACVNEDYLHFPENTKTTRCEIIPLLIKYRIAPRTTEEDIKISKTLANDADHLMHYIGSKDEIKINRQQLFYNAIDTDDTHILQILIDHGIPITDSETFRQTVRLKKPKHFKLFVENGAKAISILESIIHCTISSNRNLDDIEFLFKHGEISLSEYNESLYINPLWEAVSADRKDILQFLIDHGASISNLYPTAITANCLEPLKLLLDFEDDLDAKISNLLPVAIELNKKNVIKFFLELKDIPPSEYRSAVYSAVFRGTISSHTSAFDEETNRQIDLYFSACGGYISRIEWLLKEGSDPNIALHVAIYKQRPDIVSLLLKYGANPNFTHHEPGLTKILKNSVSPKYTAHEVTYKNKTYISALDITYIAPLTIAVDTGNYEIVRLLLEHGANPNHNNSLALRKATYNNTLC